MKKIWIICVILTILVFSMLVSGCSGTVSQRPAPEGQASVALPKATHGGPFSNLKVIFTANGHDTGTFIYLGQKLTLAWKVVGYTRADASSSPEVSFWDTKGKSNLPLSGEKTFILTESGPELFTIVAYYPQQNFTTSAIISVVVRP